MVRHMDGPQFPSAIMSASYIFNILKPMPHTRLIEEGCHWLAYIQCIRAIIQTNVKLSLIITLAAHFIEI